MKFDERFIEELKSRLRPSDVIGRTVKLKRQGREFAGLSPFTKEKSPSFFVNDEKGFFHDFSSGKHGDIISFLQETERLSFVEAVERLANEAGMALPAEDPQAAAREQRRTTLFGWTELAMKWFSANLRRSVGASTREYLKKRGLPEDQWERFGLGYAPNDRDGLKTALIQKGATPGDLVEAGLLIAPEGGGAPYDRFRDRLIFPILDDRGRVVSFGGRAMNPDDRAKYLNGPESPLFHKGATLYGMPEARKLLGTSKQASLVVVEGYMDVIACQRAGIPAVAPMGTALTEEQMARLWRVTPEPVLCFDGDAAGQRAAGRAVERALPLLKPGRSFRFCLLTDGRDPDDMLRDAGAPALREALSRTRPFVEVLFQKEAEAETLDTPERRAGLKARLRQATEAITDRDLAEQYRRDLFERFDAVMPGRGAKYAPRNDGRPSGNWRRGAPPPLAGQTPEGAEVLRSLNLALDPVIAAIAQGALEVPARVESHLEDLATFGFGHPDLDALAQELVRHHMSGAEITTGGLQSYLNSRSFSDLLHRVERAALKSGAPFLKSHGDPSEEQEAEWKNAFILLMRLQTLDAAVQAAKQNIDTPSGLDTLSRLKSERDALRRTIYSLSNERWMGGFAS
ncbi:MULTISPECIES: DNA primase [unclassified Brevundimonas]|uniref:DNA primase n=1 Tax=unclassified Brevundimonas TaxID=2622653 RepID=UPI000C5B464D|nr:MULTISPECIES: DNA primase [unclassified Brevundimonas]MAL88952.1 DNA primase [Brevundimonas sp.]